VGNAAHPSSASGRNARPDLRKPPFFAAFRHTSRVPLSRIAWLVTVGVSLLAALLLLLNDYDGYALLALAVGLSAAINLR
jgi:hypothetical protein